MVNENDKYGYIDKKGNWVIQPIFDRALNFTEGLAIVEVNGKYGFLTTPKVFADYRHFMKDQYGNIVIDQKYDYLSEIQRQMIILREDST